ncbi:hypothetical protein GGF31_000645 [Allomyces arbusculus]|nr:hypothetical protein GGF31_000645 [Allomyces arbusculus]
MLGPRARRWSTPPASVASCDHAEFSVTHSFPLSQRPACDLVDVDHEPIWPQRVPSARPAEMRRAADALMSATVASPEVVSALLALEADTTALCTESTLVFPDCDDTTVATIIARNLAGDGARSDDDVADSPSRASAARPRRDASATAIRRAPPLLPPPPDTLARLPVTILAALARDRLGALLLSPTSPFLYTGDADDGVRSVDVRSALGLSIGGANTPWDTALMESIGVRRRRFKGIRCTCGGMWKAARQCCDSWRSTLAPRAVRTDLIFVVGLRYRGAEPG